MRVAPKVCCWWLALLALTAQHICAVTRLHAQDKDFYDQVSFAPPEELLKLDPGVYQSLPGVYQLHLSGIFRIECPVSIEVDLPKLNSDTADFRKQYKIPDKIEDSYVRWVQLAKQPELYLKSASEREVYQSEKRNLGSGSCYAIDRRGILLTNRHVVSNDSAKALEADQVIACEPPPIVDLLKRLTKAIGPWNGTGEDNAFVEQGLLGWLGAQCKRTEQITDLNIAVAYSKSKSTTQTPYQQSSAARVMDLMGLDMPQPKFVPIQVLAVGSEEYANDIAVVKVKGFIDDALICLDLAEPAQVKTHARVYSMGFPGYRYDFTNMTARDLMSVTVQGGRIVRTPASGPLSMSERLKVRMLGIEDAQDLLFVSAYSNHGSSGGPIILSDGSVAGMTVCGAHLPIDESQEGKGSTERNAAPFDTDKSILTGQPLSVAGSVRAIEQNRRSRNLAVPLTKLKAFLQQHGIQPDPGPTTKAWRDALAAYRSGDLKSCEAKLKEVEAKQVYMVKILKPYESPVTPPMQITSHYVAELLTLVKR